MEAAAAGGAQGTAGGHTHDPGRLTRPAGWPRRRQGSALGSGCAQKSQSGTTAAVRGGSSGRCGRSTLRPARPRRPARQYWIIGTLGSGAHRQTWVMESVRQARQADHTAAPRRERARPGAAATQATLTAVGAAS